MNLATKLEEAAKRYHGTKGTGYNGYANIDVENIAVPYVLFIGEKGEEAPLYSGNYKLRLMVQVRDSADTGGGTRLNNHRAGSGKVFEAFQDNELDVFLSAQLEDFTIQKIFGHSGAVTRQEDRQWISEITIDLYGCDTDLDLELAARPAEPDTTVIGDQSGNPIGDQSGQLIGI